ncbi:AzlC family ABC transporter permease [Ruminiclostridium cellobioparum]|uniref:Putative branched-chain amino acid permease (Azaleucine resistance) n=1 Tax=Ruminiclostridium cellobioparum subsp. termitidis CT1112 TaxID=1195236 RepID=S0FYX5_RUMCE|nr:AzlC family ABC transporter permease [Ruminiclostridium cellobioparum]EMS73768.1 putative branched-chain amino acid permease (azaleucine resistance) [Ruminiclostridium cellobioparum subsp. termitidis CT1112]
MNIKVKALKAAFPHTLPVLAGFLFLGVAYGILMKSIGYGAGWTFLMSFLVFAGSMQYVGITLLTATFNPLYALFITLMVNARHIFYGISMLEKFKNTGRFKPYLIFAMCDESFSILCSAKPEKDVDKNWFMFFIVFLNRWYWITGSVLGALLGNYIKFNTKGLDFALTALFVVIFINQWQEQKNHFPAVVGVLSSAACLLIFGPDKFIIPAMILILIIFTFSNKKIYKGENL